jgi:hypothetical protein
MVARKRQAAEKRLEAPMNALKEVNFGREYTA